LIGGALTPSVFSQAQSVVAQPAASSLVNPNLMIGDYVQGNLGNVLGTAYRQ
jgi:hypothetical protein